MHISCKTYIKHNSNNSKGIWNRLEYRPLEGLFTQSPVQFYLIGGNLPFRTCHYECKHYGNQLEMHCLFQLCIHENINSKLGYLRVLSILSSGSSSMITDLVLESTTFWVGIHFTDQQKYSKNALKRSVENFSEIKSYPRIVGETGGKDFLVVHSSAHPREFSTAIAWGAFEYQGQKCSCKFKSISSRIFMERYLERTSRAIGTSNN